MLSPSERRPAIPRVAYFPDSFHEINGVAHTSRHFEAYARRHQLPFLCIRAGNRSISLEQHGELTTLELPRGFLSFPLDKDLRIDPLFFRFFGRMTRALREFGAELIHITGPSDLGIMGAWLAYELRLPLAASWHTNVHEYAATRSHRFLGMLPKTQARASAQWIEEATLRTTAWFYSLARVTFAPNLDLCRLLERHTKRPCYLMQRGVDTHLFAPEKRDRAGNGDPSDFVLGFVGRLSIEKNVALLAQIQQELEAQGLTNFRFLIVGQGLEESWLRARLPRAEFTGVLRGEELARAYARMDLFVFPSHTDTFGNVVLEALASGVPAIVTPNGGPRYIVRDGETGHICADAGFSQAIAGILRDPARHAEMRRAARAYALTASWDAVFDSVYAGYQEACAGKAALCPR
jgi:phosphatidylinositol alpha 1,6-mannosyltransferase